MSGMFDDLIPQQQGGMFDDLIPNEPQDKSSGVTGDLWRSLKQGAVRMADMPGQAVRYASGFMGITPEWAKDSGEWADRRVAEIEAQKTPEGQLADQRLNEAVVDRPPTEEDVLPPGTAGMMGSGFATGETRLAPQYALRPENITARGVANAAAESAPSMAAQYVLGRGVTGALNTAGKVGKLAEEAAVAARVKNAAIGQATTNAGTVAAQTFDDTYAEAKKAGLSDEEALKRAYEASGIVAPVAAVTGGALGAVVTPGAKTAGKGFGKAAAKLAEVVGGGAAEEGTENLTQAGAQNVAMGRDFINAQSINSALQGALVGGPFALGAHGAERALERAPAPAPAVDATTVLDAEAPAAAPLALPAPRVVVNSRGEAVREGDGRVFDEPPAKTSGRADPGELRQAVRDELVALGYEPAQRATPTPITVDSAGQARTDDQTAVRDTTVEPPAKTVGRAPVDVPQRTTEELRALGYDPTQRATPTPITVDPAGNAAVAGDTREASTAAEETLDARARKLFPKDELAREDWKVQERARELGYEARVRELAQASNARKKKRGVAIQTDEQAPMSPARVEQTWKDAQPTAELGVVSRKLPDGSTEYAFATQPDVRLVVKPSDQVDARAIVQAPEQGQPQLLRAALADGPVAAGPKSLPRGIAQQIGAATDRFGVTRLIGRASDKAKMQAETARMAASSATALATKKFAQGTPEAELASKAIALDPKRAATALRTKDSEQAISGLREITGDVDPNQDTTTPMAEIEKDPRAVYREIGLPDDPEFVNYVTEAGRDAVKAGHLTSDEFFSATRAARENRPDEAMAILRKSDERRGAAGVNSSGARVKAVDPEMSVNLEPTSEFDHQMAHPEEMGVEGTRLADRYNQLAGDDRKTLGSALRDLVSMGVPRAWIDGIQNFWSYSDERRGAATYWLRNGRGEMVSSISFHDSPMDSEIPSPRASEEEHKLFRGRLAHELAHHADRIPGTTTFRSQSDPAWQITTESGILAYKGEIARELLGVRMQQPDSALGKLLAYPVMNHLKREMASDVVAPELFAQSVRAYFTNRAELQRLAPKTYEAVHEFVTSGGNAAGAGLAPAVPGQVRQEPDGGPRPDAARTVDAGGRAGAADGRDSRAPVPADGLPGRRGEVGGSDGLQPERTGDRGGRDESRGDPSRADAQDGGSRIAPLPGYAHGNIRGAAGPDPRIVAVAEQYARDHGINLRRQSRYAEVDPQRAARIAAAYEAMPHAPQDPKVREAYDNLIRQTVAQYRALESAGYRFWFMDPEADPYGGNPWNAMRDLRANRSMAVFPTDAGFGTNAEFDPSNNPLLADTGITWPSGSPDGKPKRVLANDLFRAVHDAFGHGMEGAGFRAQGEENAWQAHARLFTGSALAALTSETRGQNSWLNFGPHGEANRNAKVEDTVFADQKTGLMPEWTWNEGLDGESGGMHADRPTSAAAAQKAVSLEQYLYTDKLVMTPKFRNQAELGAWLDEKAQKALGRSLVGDYSPESLKHVSGVFSREGELAMTAAGNAGQWYRSSIEGALGNAAKLYPEIGSDPNHKFMFTLSLAVTSNGTDMATNTRLGFSAYEHWRVLGKLPLALKGAGERGKNMTDSFDAVNRLIEKAGNVDTVREFMLTKRTVREIREGLASIGVRVSGAENADAVVYGGYALGPKIGAAFLPNLNGHWDALTADRWFSRTFNRIVGGLVGPDGKTVDAPRSGSERQFMRDALNAAIAKLKRKGHDLEMADLQALLWYPEKELYAQMGVSDKRAAPTDYEQETRKYVEARLQSQEPAAAGAGAQPGGRQRNPQGGAQDQRKQVALFDAAGDPDKSFSLGVDVPAGRGRVAEELDRLKGSRAARAGSAAAKVAAPVTAAAQAANKVTDRIGEEVARVTGLKKAGEKIVGAVDKAISKKSSWSWVERAKQGLISDYGLPEEYLTAKIAKQSRENKLLREAKHTLDRLSGMNPDQLAVAYQWLQEKPDTARERELISRLPADQRDVVQKMKDDIDRLSQEAVKLGLISQETYERNRMAYVHRSYKKYEAELSSSQIAARQRAQRLKGDQFKGRGMEMEASLDRVHGELPQELKGMKVQMLEKRDADGRLRRREYVVAGQSRPAGLRDYTAAGTWEVRDATKDGNIKIWRDFTLEERQRMGEIEDARYGFARTMLQGVRDVETARFLRWTADKYAEKSPDGLNLVDIKPLAQLLGNQTFTADEWVKVPEVHIAGTSIPRYGDLAGKYVPGIMWNDLAGVMELRNGAWDKMLSAWKISKTALSPAVHVNNVMANFIMADLADVGPNDIRKALQTILDAKGGNAEAKALVERYEDSGAESGSFAANEIKTSVLEPLLQQIAESEPEAVQKASLAQVVSLLAHGKIGEAASASTRTLPGRAIGGTVESMIRAYQSEDSVFRLAKFLNEVEAGKTDLQAGRAAREAFLNYDINAPWVRAARRTVLPFVSFTYRAVPLLARAMATKPWKFAKYAALGYALNMLAYGMLGDQADEEQEKRLLPDEMQGTYYGIPKMMRMPWNSGDNDPMWLDVRRWLPGGDVADVNNSKSAVPLPQWLSVGGPLSLLSDFYSNTNSWGDKIVHPSDSAGQVIEKTSDMLLKFMLPNLPLPGIGWVLRQVGAPVDTGMLDPYAWSSIERAARGAKSGSGKETSGVDAAANAVGVKLQSRRIADELSAVARNQKAQERDIKTEIARVKGGMASGKIDQTEGRRRIQREIEKLRELGKKTAAKLTPQT